jgi:hypothetical protein
MLHEPRTRRRDLQARFHQRPPPSVWALLALASAWIASCSATSGQEGDGTGTPNSTSGGGFAGASGGGGSSVGTGGALPGDGGSGGAGGVGGAAASGGGSNLEDAGTDPSRIPLAAVPANGTVGLEWSRIAGATGYRLYWSNTPGVSQENGQVLNGVDPGYVHRGLTNGTTYYYVVTALGPAGEGPPSNEAKATPSGQWVLEQLGSGDFDDILTGSRIARIPIERRVHVFLLPEGYTSADLPTFHSDASHGGDRRDDVDRWIDEVFALEAYATFREALVVWFLPVASNTHTDGGDTAFHVQVSSSGVGATTGAAAPLWDALDDQGTDAFSYPPTAGARNYVSAFLIFDPRSGRAGVSGLTTSLRGPTTGLSIPASFGIGHSHEFTHGFSGVRDEYMETNNMPRGASETSNVVASNKCSDLPWAHLLEGNGINKTPNLVGAFGRPDRGYHSELKCLMNGTHDNGQYWCTADVTGAYPSLTLRVPRMCNYCRELTAYRVFERTGVLSGPSSFDTWKSTYRSRFYERFAFEVPDGPLPQTLTCRGGGTAEPVFEGCAP